jgi:hypothetical protein
MPTASNSRQVNMASTADCGCRFIQPASACPAQKLNGAPQFVWLAENVLQEMSHHFG